MRNGLGELARKGLAVLVLLAVAYLAFKLLVGVVTALAWVVVALVAVVAVVWAVRTL